MPRKSVCLLLVPFFMHLNVIAGEVTIDRKGEPIHYREFDAYQNQKFNPLFDMGSWFGFLLPNSHELGAFPGPMVIAQEYPLYIARSLEKIAIIENTTHKVYSLAQAKLELISKPGQLIQQYSFDDFTLSLVLQFIDSRSALVTTKITNKSPNKKQLQISWSGQLIEQWDAKTPLTALADNWQPRLLGHSAGISINFPDISKKWQMMFADNASYRVTRNISTEQQVKDDRYMAKINAELDEQLTFFTLHQYFHSEQELVAYDQTNPELFKQIAEKSQQSQARWQTYLKNVAYKPLATKLVETLIGNWRSSAGALKYSGVVPSTTARWFNGFWAWDSWKHAVALSRFAPELAKDNIFAMFDYQITAKDELRAQDAGMIIDAIFYNKDASRKGVGGNWNERNTKPPLATWAVWQVYQQTKDLAFLTALYQPLVNYHNWWLTNRDSNGNGVLEYGGSLHRLHNNSQGQLIAYLPKEEKSLAQRFKCNDLPSSYQCWLSIADINYALKTTSLDLPLMHAAGWESGMDNAGRFGFINKEQISHYSQTNGLTIKQAREHWQLLPQAVTHGGNIVGFTIDQESVDLNSFYALDAKLLAKIAALLGDFDNAVTFEKRAQRLTKYIRQCMFDSDTGFFYDIKIDSVNKASQNRQCSGQPLTNRGKGPEGWAPLFANLATPIQAKAVIEQLNNEKTFNTFVPFPTASVDNPAFDPDIYWRGRVWLDQVYFAIKGLKNYGEDQLAKTLADKLIANASGLTGDDSVRENYHPFTGKQQGATNFSWSAAMLLEILFETEE